MKISEAIHYAGLVEKGNVMEEELAVLWLSELDGMIQSDIMLHAPEEIVSYASPEDELLLKPPHDKLYVDYLVMMIRQVQQEYEGYNNAQDIVNEKLRTFQRWYVQNYRPADSLSRDGAYSGCGTMGFAYITAYGLAVQQGYRGSLEEWLKSLEGAPGEAARMRYDPEREMIQWGTGEQWYDLFTLAQLRDPAAAAIMAQAEAAAGRAERAEANAAAAANLATGKANAAEGSASAAAGYAEDAKTSAQTAANLANGALQAQRGAEAAARRAEEAARNIGVDGVKITDGDSVGVWLRVEGTEQKPVLHLYGDYGDEPAVVRNVARAELDRDAAPLGQVKELIAAAGNMGQGGGSISAAGDGDDIVISTTLAVRAEGDDIVIGG